MSTPGALYSRLNHPVTLRLTDGTQIRVSPRATVRRVNKEMLPAKLPTGVVFKPSRQ